jgi:hypothetical protein
MRKLAALIVCIGLTFPACYTRYQVSLAELGKLERGKEPPDFLVAEDGRQVPTGRLSSVVLATADGSVLPLAMGEFKVSVSPPELEVLGPEPRAVPLDQLAQKADVRTFSPGKTVAVAVTSGVLATIVVPAIIIVSVMAGGQKSFSGRE